MTQPWNVIALAVIASVAISGILAQLEPAAAQIGIRALAVFFASSIVLIYWPFVRVAASDVRSRLRSSVSPSGTLKAYHLLGLGILLIGVAFALPYIRITLAPEACASGTGCHRAVQFAQVFCILLSLAFIIAGPLTFKIVDPDADERRQKRRIRMAVAIGVGLGVVTLGVNIISGAAG